MIFTYFNIQLITALLILSTIVLPIALYKRSKSLRFRIIETEHYADCKYYTPQVRIDGTWYNIVLVNAESVKIHTNSRANHFSPKDSLEFIEEFKSAGNFTIPSNRKLNKNEKQIIVE